MQSSATRSGRSDRSLPRSKFQSDRATAECLPSKHQDDRRERDDRRQSGWVEIKRAGEVAPQQGLSRSGSAAKRTRKTGRALENARRQTWRRMQDGGAERQKRRASEHGDDDGGRDRSKLSLIKPQRRSSASIGLCARFWHECLYSEVPGKIATGRDHTPVISPLAWRAL